VRAGSHALRHIKDYETVRKIRQSNGDRDHSKKQGEAEKPNE